MKTFKINKELEIVCEYKNTRRAFKHEATLLRNGNEIDNTKICYSNRTWESYEYQSVLNKLIDKTTELTDKEKKSSMKFIKNYQEGNEDFNTIKTIATLGEIFHKGNQKAINDWKAKMIKAGLGNRGLIMPEDWSTLSEDEKERRLNGAISVL